MLYVGVISDDRITMEPVPMSRIDLSEERM